MNIEQEPKTIYIKNHPYWKFNNDIILNIDKDKYLKTNILIKNITLHWTGGTNKTLHDDYHILISDTHCYISQEISTRWHYHCYGANPNNLGIALCGMFNATEKNMGMYPIAIKQIESASKLVAVVKKHFAKAHFHDHKYFADLNGYYKWDCRYVYSKQDAKDGLIPYSEIDKTIFEVIDHKSNWYKNKYL